MILQTHGYWYVYKSACLSVLEKNRSNLETQRHSYSEKAATPLGTSPSLPPSTGTANCLRTCLHRTWVQLHVPTPNEEEQGRRHTCYSHQVQKEEGDPTLHHTRVGLGGRGGARLLRSSSFQQPPHSAAVEQTDGHTPLLGGDRHGCLHGERGEHTLFTHLLNPDTLSTHSL